eukprot:g13820.t1
MGDGTEPRVHIPHAVSDLIRIPDHLLSRSLLIEDLVSDVHGDLADENITDPDFLSRRLILTTRNTQAAKINKRVVDRLTDPENTSIALLSADSVGLSRHSITVKKGTMVVLLRNMDTAHGLCNGTRLIIESASNFRISAHIINEGPHQVLRVTLSRVMHTTNPDHHLPFLLKRTQFPIALAYAMTIHKAEGQTIKKACVFLSEPVFSHGQLLSDYHGLAIQLILKFWFVTFLTSKASFVTVLILTYTRNIVYPNLRQDPSYPRQSKIQDEPQYASYEITSHRSSRIAQAHATSLHDFLSSSDATTESSSAHAAESVRPSTQRHTADRCPNCGDENVQAVDDNIMHCGTLLNCPVCDGSNPEDHDNNYRYDLDDLDSDSDSLADSKDNSNRSNTRISDLKAKEEDLVANLRIKDQHISQTEFPDQYVLINHARLRADLQRIQNELTELETKTSFRCPAAARRMETRQCLSCEQPFRISAANIDAHICTDCFARRPPTTTNTNHDQTTSSSERTCLLCAEANIEAWSSLDCCTHGELICLQCMQRILETSSLATVCPVCKRLFKTINGLDITQRSSPAQAASSDDTLSHQAVQALLENDSASPNQPSTSRRLRPRVTQRTRRQRAELSSNTSNSSSQFQPRFSSRNAINWDLIGLQLEVPGYLFLSFMHPWIEYAEYHVVCMMPKHISHQFFGNCLCVHMLTIVKEEISSQYKTLVPTSTTWITFNIITKSSCS